MGPSQKEPAGSFEACLSEFARRDAEAKPRWRAAAFVWDGPVTPNFAKAAEAAFEDFVTTIPDERSFPRDDVDSVASELQLPSARDRDMLKTLRRRFMWDNHPDRRPDLPRDIATRRVAIANMLIDRALKLHASR